MPKKGWSGTKPTDFMHRVEDDLIGMQHRIASEALEALIKGSPVDTGAFRGNHRISIGSPDYGYDPSLGSKEPPKGHLEQATWLRESQKLRTMRAPYTVIYIQNNLPYSEALEHGHSGQAPQGIYGIVSNDMRQKYGT